LKREVTAISLGNYTLIINFMTHFAAKIAAISNNSVTKIGVNYSKTEE
jgi:hypothetical protein